MKGFFGGVGLDVYSRVSNDDRVSIQPFDVPLYGLEFFIHFSFR
jgi:hypothetical protein